MTKLDADLFALQQLLLQGDAEDMKAQATALSDVVQAARQALDDRASVLFTGQGFTTTTGFTERVLLDHALPVHLHITITLGLDDSRPDPRAVTRAERLIEAVEEAFRGQVRLMQVTLD